MSKIIANYSAFEAALDCPSKASGLTVVQVVNAPGVSPLGLLGLVSLKVTLKGAQASEFGLIYSSTSGTPIPASSTQGQKVSSQGGPVSPANLIGQMNNAWSAQPTYPVSPAYIRRALLSGSVGNSILWTWPEDDPADLGGLSLVNVGAGASSGVLVSARWIQYIAQ